MSIATTLLGLVILVSSAAETEARERSTVDQAGGGRTAPPAVAEILRADYEGDRAALRRLGDELAVPVEVGRTAARIRYWRGFARWRSVINGYNDGAERQELVDDLQSAIHEFEQALAQDAQFADAKAGLMSCAGLLAGLSAGDATRVSTLTSRYGAIVKELTAAPSDNPRVLWVVGLSPWYAPSGTPQAQIEERQARAMATYARGLEIARSQKGAAGDPLEPAWGEAELLMGLAWSHLNKGAPDVTAAERYARESLTMVPYWHDVRDILLPQIQKAKRPAQRE